MESYIPWCVCIPEEPLLALSVLKDFVKTNLLHTSIQYMKYIVAPDY